GLTPGDNVAWPAQGDGTALIVRPLDQTFIAVVKLASIVDRSLTYFYDSELGQPGQILLRSDTYIALPDGTFGDELRGSQIAYAYDDLPFRRPLRYRAPGTVAAINYEPTAWNETVVSSLNVSGTVETTAGSEPFSRDFFQLLRGGIELREFFGQTND